MIPPQRLARLGSLLLFSLGLFLTLCFLTYHPQDIPLLSSHPHRPALNLGGTFGAWIGFVGRAGFGWACMMLPLLCGIWGYRLWQEEEAEVHGIPFTLACVCLIAGLGTLMALHAPEDPNKIQWGGITGYLFARNGAYYIGAVGTWLAAFCTVSLSWMLVSGLSFGLPSLQSIRELWSRLMQTGQPKPLGMSSKKTTKSSGRVVPAKSKKTSAAYEEIFDDPEEADDEEYEDDDEEYEDEEEDEDEYEDEDDEELEEDEEFEDEEDEDEEYEDDDEEYEDEEDEDEEEDEEDLEDSKPKIRIRSEKKEPQTTVAPVRARNWGSPFSLPPMDTLTTPPELSEERLTEDLQANAKRLERTLAEFGIQGRVDGIDRGPTVTRYEVTPAPGVKLAKIVTLADELALAMKANSCNVVAPIPGKGRVGIDVPNISATKVYLKEILTSANYVKDPSPLLLPVGKDVSGKPLTTDLAKCPHLLIAGATGAGKTVSLHGLLIGMLMRNTPDQVQFLMVDPKMVELSLFNGIPHLVAPVVTNPKKASMALGWAVSEMERRYQLLARCGVRNIISYNEFVIKHPRPELERDENGEEIPADEPLHEGHLPYLVVVIDELADLMLVAAQDVETCIARLAQLSRAVGIHMIIATQRPSVDVITGVIKANFPARLAFQVSSKVDSRTILDANGADKLIGRGDLLFLPPGCPKALRAQGAFVGDEEIEAITTFLKRQQDPVYNEGLLKKQEQPEAVGGGERDAMYDEALDLIIDAGQASTSFLQRRLRIGYGRAARMLDQFEQEGIVGPPQGSKPREVLVSREVE